MIYRDAGEMKTSYAADLSLFPVRLDRIGFGLLMLAAFVVLPLIGNSYWLGSILLPFLILSVAALGLNIITGYAGQLSLGTAAFMAVGAYMSANFVVRLPMLPFPVAFVLAGLVAAAIGVLFGLLSARIKGFYIAVATLAAQFFIEWLCTHAPWLTMGNASGIVSTPPLSLFGVSLASVEARYLVALTAAVLLALGAKNMVRSSLGRSWMAVRDQETAAELMGVDTFRAKLSAFAVSSFYAGIAGALWVFLYLGNIEVEGFTLHRSFQILFMVIIGGLGSIAGAFLGAGFIILLPVAITNGAGLFGAAIRPDLLANVELMVFGGLIILFLILEPHGLARLAARFRDALRRWPLPY